MFQGKPSKKASIKQSWQFYQDNNYKFAVAGFKEILDIGKLEDYVGNGDSDAINNEYVDACFALIVLFKEGVPISKQGDEKVKKRIKLYSDFLRKRMSNSDKRAKFYLEWLTELFDTSKKESVDSNKLLIKLCSTAYSKEVTPIQSVSVACILLKKNIDKFNTNKDNKTVLCIAVENEQFELAKFLLDNQFPFFASTSVGYPRISEFSLLSKAVKGDDPKIVQKLLESGVILDGENPPAKLHIVPRGRGKTSRELFDSIERRKQERQKIVDSLESLAHINQDETLQFAAGILRLETCESINSQKQITSLMGQAFNNGRGIDNAACYLWLLDNALFTDEMREFQIPIDTLFAKCENSDYPLAALLLGAIYASGLADVNIDEYKANKFFNKAKINFYKRQLGHAPKLTHVLLEHLFKKEEISEEYKLIISLILINIDEINQAAEKELIERRFGSNAPIEPTSSSEYLKYATDRNNIWALKKFKEFESKHESKSGAFSSFLDAPSSTIIEESKSEEEQEVGQRLAEIRRERELRDIREEMAHLRELVQPNKSFEDTRGGLALFGEMCGLEQEIVEAQDAAKLEMSTSSFSQDKKKEEKRTKLAKKEQELSKLMSQAEGIIEADLAKGSDEATPGISKEQLEKMLEEQEEQQSKERADYNEKLSSQLEKTEKEEVDELVQLCDARIELTPSQLSEEMQKKLDALNSKIQALEKQLTPLQRQYKSQQAQKRLEQYITTKSGDTVKEFYNTIFRQLNRLFLVLQMASTQTFVLRPGAAHYLLAGDSKVGGVSLIFGALAAIGAPIVGAGEKALDKGNEKLQDGKARKGEALLESSLVANENLARKTALYLAYRYKNALLRINHSSKTAPRTSEGGAHVLGLYTAGKIIKGMVEGKVPPKNRQGEEFVSAMLQLVSEEKLAERTVEKEAGSVKIGTVIPFINQKMKAVDGEELCAESLVRNKTGLMILNDDTGQVEFYVRKETKINTEGQSIGESKDLGNAEKYGYRWATQKEKKEIEKIKKRAAGFFEPEYSFTQFEEEWVKEEKLISMSELSFAMQEITMARNIATLPPVKLTGQSDDEVALSDLEEEEADTDDDTDESTLSENEYKEGKQSKRKIGFVEKEVETIETIEFKREFKKAQSKIKRLETENAGIKGAVDALKKIIRNQATQLDSLTSMVSILMQERKPELSLSSYSRTSLTLSKHDQSSKYPRGFLQRKQEEQSPELSLQPFPLTSESSIYSRISSPADRDISEIRSKLLLLDDLYENYDPTSPDRNSLVNWYLGKTLGEEDSDTRISRGLQEGGLSQLIKEETERLLALADEQTSLLGGSSSSSSSSSSASSSHYPDSRITTKRTLPGFKSSPLPVTRDVGVRPGDVEILTRTSPVCSSSRFPSPSNEDRASTSEQLLPPQPPSQPPTG